MLTFLIIPLLSVKLAFLYIDERNSFQFGINKRQTPTYRVSMRVYPEIKKPKITAALSEVRIDNTVKPNILIAIPEI